jgi:hypothetical protein
VPVSAETWSRALADELAVLWAPERPGDARARLRQRLEVP